MKSTVGVGGIAGISTVRAIPQTVGLTLGTRPTQIAQSKKSTIFFYLLLATRPFPMWNGKDSAVCPTLKNKSLFVHAIPLQHATAFIDSQVTDEHSKAVPDFA
jgi:hypothetical protein